MDGNIPTRGKLIRKSKSSMCWMLPVVSRPQGRIRIAASSSMAECRPLPVLEKEPDSEWAQIKANIRAQIGEIPSTNWFDRTRQIEQCGPVISVAIPDELTREYLESEYRQLIDREATGIGIAPVLLVVSERL